MSAVVALKLLLQGQREVASGVGDVTKQTSALGVAADKTSIGLKKMSGGLDTMAKEGLGVSSALTKASAQIVVAEKKVADALKTSALAAKQAADMKVRAANLSADAVAKSAAGDLQAAAASREAAKAATEQAVSYTKMAAAMRSQATAARASLQSVRASSARGAVTGGAFGALAKGGSYLGKAGLGIGAYLGYEGVKSAAALSSQTNQLNTLANVPLAETAALQKWALRNSVGLRAPASQLEQEMYRIASAAPGKTYSARTIENLTSGAQKLGLVGGPTVDYDQSARLFGIVRANGFNVGANRLGALARATIGSGDMTAGDLISAIGTGGLLPNAARHKMSLLSTFGVLAQLGDLGINGSRAGNAFQHAISLIASPNHQASGIYESLGLKPTELDQVMRTGGLLPALSLLQKRLTTNASIAEPGMSGTVGDFLGQGFSRKQAIAMAGQGNQSLQDLALTRMFGGAKQAVPIIALLSGLQRTGSKTSEIAASSTPGSLQRDFLQTANTPANTFKRFDLDIQKLETDIGLKLIPKLESMANWVSRNEGLVEGIGKTLEVLAIPAIAAWGTSLATKGVSGLSSFSRGLQNTEGGLGLMQKSVMGVVAAVGVYGFGATTANTAMGAGEATLGGALAGMTAGLAVGGPWGAAIGAAGGALVGLAGHFHLLTGGVNSSTKALDGWMTTAYQADNFKIGKQFKAQLVQYLSGQSVGVTGALADSGITTSMILSEIRAGVPGSGAAYNKLISARNSGKISQQEYLTGSQALSSLDDAFQSKVQVWNNLATIEGKTTQTEKAAAQHIQAFLRQTATGSGGASVNGSLAALLTGGAPVTIVLHNHTNIDGREVTHTVVKHLADLHANLGGDAYVP